MKKLIVLFLLATIMAIACSPVSKTAKITSPAAVSPAAGTVLSKVSLENGQQLFTTKCGRCHDLPITTDYSKERWTKILGYMIPKARITELRASEDLTAYVMANAKH